MPSFDLAALIAKFPWLTMASGALISCAAVLLLSPLARRVGWIDRPSERKSHVGEIPLIGGWCVLLALLGLQLVAPRQELAPAGYWVGALLLFIVALIDDRFPIRARYRFLVQVAAAVAGVSFGGQSLTTLGDLFGVGVLSQWWIALPVTVLGTVAVINAVNFTDGVDGLCAGLGLVSLFWFLIAVAIATSLAGRIGVESLPYATSLIPLAAAVMGGLAGFLWFNMRSPWRPRAVAFLGDSGSMLIGFTLAWFAVHVASAYGVASVPPVVCLWIVAAPLADSAACIVRRVASGVKPSTPDLKHIHHLLGRLGYTPGQSVVLILAGSFICGLVGVGGWWLGLPEFVLFWLFMIALAVFVAATGLAWRRLDDERVVSTASVRTGA